MDLDGIRTEPNNQVRAGSTWGFSVLTWFVGTASGIAGYTRLALPEAKFLRFYEALRKCQLISINQVLWAPGGLLGNQQIFFRN